ncbi:MAG: urease accessory protein UreD [Tepidisphaeraceae bacterium]
MTATAEPSIDRGYHFGSLCGDVVCERVAGRSALTRVWSTDPLKILTPRNADSAKTITLSTYGGGLLGGDEVNVRVAVKPAAELVLTTQSAGKAYRTTGPASVQTLSATVEDAGLLAVLPDVTCPFAEAHFVQRQRFELSAGGNLVWLDWLSSGRRARGERWAMRAVENTTEIVIDGKTRLRETLALAADGLPIDSFLRVGKFDCLATMAVAGPRFISMIESARAAIREMPLAPRATLLAADSLFPGGAIFRILGPDVQAVQMLLRRLLEPLDALLGHAPWGRKW